MTATHDTKRIAKNTFIMYIRMFVMMLVSLYTSRVILNVLGVEDYGTYNVVGGVVSMFTLLTASMSASISRYLTFSLGKGDYETLRRVFSVSVEVQIAMAIVIVYTGQLDEFFEYRYGHLNFRTVRFETEVKPQPNYQGNAVVNYTDAAVPYTRIIEHKHFEQFGQQVYDNPHTVISREYSTEWQPGMEPYYPVNDEANNTLADRYRALAATLSPSVIFGGRLAEYKYYDMAPIIEKVMGMWE